MNDQFLIERLQADGVSEDDVKLFRDLYSMRYTRQYRKPAMQDKREFVNRMVDRAIQSILPTVPAPEDQITLLRDHLNRGSKIMAIDLEWSQGGDPFVYEVGFCEFSEDSFKTTNLMIRHPQDPKANPDHKKFRQVVFEGSLEQTPQDAAETVQNMISDVDLFVFHGVREDALRLFHMGCSVAGKPAIDTFECAGFRMPEGQKLSVGGLYRYFGHDDMAIRHVAGYDAMMTAKIAVDLANL